MLNLREKYRGNSLIRNSAPLGPYRRTMNRVLGWFWGGGVCFFCARYPCTLFHHHTRQNPEVNLVGAKDRTIRILGMWRLCAIAETEPKTEWGSEKLSP